MAKEYKVGERYYLPVTVKDGIGTSYNYPIVLEFVDCEGRDTTDTICIADEPDLLLTAEDIAMVINTENEDALAELKSRNAELEALLKEVMATRDEAIRQNDELIAENKKLKSDCNEWKDTANERLNAVQTLSEERNKVMAGVDELKNTLVDRTKDVQHLTEENDKLKAELDQRNKDFDAMKKDRDNLLADNKRTTAYYMEANKTATEAAEANDELKAKIADLRNRVGEQLAQIQDLSAEVHFHKEFGEGLDKQQKELQARYDELDSVNKEQAEKIRKLDAERDTWERNAKAWKMTADGMSKRAEELQAENEKLNNRNKYLESEKNRKPIVHVLTNDGHVYAFTSSGKVSVKYHTELNILMIEDGEKTIAGFSRGDKPGNLSAWWMG